MSESFAQLGLPESLVAALAKRGVTEPFPIQSVTIADVLSGRDVSGKAPTGSGKTLAFGLPVLAKVGVAHENRPRALVLAPTRELAEQIKRELTPLAGAMHRTVLAVYGGVGYGPQKSALRKGVDVLVATPGRLEDLIAQRSVSLRDVDIVVVDEADRMADMGFLPVVKRLLDQTAKRRQTLLFSATLDGDVAVLVRDYQHKPVRHEAGTVEPETSDARHHFWLVDQQERVQHTANVVDASGRTIVFTRTRHGADRLARQLIKLDVGAVALHGGRSQNQRNRALRAFSAGDAQALVATDVAARGIHIDAVDAVVHFDPPADAKDYVHRSGRTARAGASGTVVSLITNQQRRAVGQMQRELSLEEPISAPRVDAILHDGWDLHGVSVGRSSRPQSVGAKETKAEATRPEPRRRSPEGGSARPRKQKTQPTGKSVYVANLPWGSTEADIHQLFGRYGKVHQVTVITNRKTGRSKGFGFVDMAPQAAQTAIKGLHGSRFGGRDLTVRFAQPRRWGN
jgi:superfamily II DNA/RNA helicase